jgi:hypothetical protein
MSYQTDIPTDFVPRQFTDAKFHSALEAYRSGGHRATGPWVCAIPRPDLDPSSRVHFEFAEQTYGIDAKTDKVAVMHVMSAGPGRVRLGYREHIPVSVGDLVLLNLREAGHFIYIEGILTYWFTGDVAMARIYRTAKPRTPPLGKDERSKWQDELYWNIKDVLNDYVVLGQDPNAERLYRNGPETRVFLPDSAHIDGMRSDNARDDRFPIVYRRVLGVGPGRVFRRESELGIIERDETKSEAQPGDMMCYSKSVRAASLMFQGMPLEIIHAASCLDLKASDGTNVEVHESLTTPIPWDVPTEE